MCNHQQQGVQVIWNKRQGAPSSVAGPDLFRNNPRVAAHLNLALDHVDGVGGLHLKGDSLPGESLDEDLHIAMWPAWSVSVKRFVRS